MSHRRRYSGDEEEGELPETPAQSKSISSKWSNPLDGNNPSGPSSSRNVPPVKVSSYRPNKGLSPIKSIPLPERPKLPPRSPKRLGSPIRDEAMGRSGTFYDSYMPGGDLDRPTRRSPSPILKHTSSSSSRKRPEEPSFRGREEDSRYRERERSRYDEWSRYDDRDRGDRRHDPTREDSRYRDREYEDRRYGDRHRRDDHRSSESGRYDSYDSRNHKRARGVESERDDAAHKSHRSSLVEEEGEIKASPNGKDAPVEDVRPPSPSGSPPPLAQSQHIGEESYRPPKIKNRPTRTLSDRQPAPPLDRPPSPDFPPPPPSGPPPPPDTPPPSIPHESLTDPNTPVPPSDPLTLVSNGKATNRLLEETKLTSKYDVSPYEHKSNGRIPTPHAPNPNLRNPPTRESTPMKAEVLLAYEANHKDYKRMTAEDELLKLHKTFKGTATLAMYKTSKKLGEGTFGVVTMAHEVESGRSVALKKLITHNPRDGVSVTTIREIKIIKSLSHPNVVPILNMVVEAKKGKESGRHEVFMVFPYVDHDLCGLLKNEDFRASHSVCKLLMKQIIEGMAYIHTHNVIHRDIKTANILVDKNGRIMIADFGLARPYTANKDMSPHTDNEYTNMVVTRWYRAPELLLGDTRYGPAVDMWSLGCVLGELYHKEPILAGDSDRSQLLLIIDHCGPLNNKKFPGWDALPGFPDSKGYHWDKVPEGVHILELAQQYKMDRAGGDLLAKLLTLDPKMRITAKEALLHSWFWISPLPANVNTTDLGVSSSHEMTTRRKGELPPAPPPRPPPHQPSINPYGRGPRPPQNGNWNQHNQNRPLYGNQILQRPPQQQGSYAHPPPPPYAHPNAYPQNQHYNNQRPPVQNYVQPYQQRPPDNLPIGPRAGVPPLPFLPAQPKIGPPQAPFVLAGPGANRAASAKRPGPPMASGDHKRPRESDDGLPY